MMNGNHGCTYNIGMRNCRNGIKDGENQATYKLALMFGRNWLAWHSIKNKKKKHAHDSKNIE